MIEIGEMSEFRMTYDDAVMYCFCLGDGWRLPTYDEYQDPLIYSECWSLDERSNSLWHVTPVRLKDD
jgi:hypothetical protein